MFEHHYRNEPLVDHQIERQPQTLNFTINQLLIVLFDETNSKFVKFLGTACIYIIYFLEKMYPCENIRIVYMSFVLSMFDVQQLLVSITSVVGKYRQIARQVHTVSNSHEISVCTRITGSAIGNAIINDFYKYRRPSIFATLCDMSCNRQYLSGLVAHRVHSLARRAMRVMTQDWLAREREISGVFAQRFVIDSIFV